jgi:hypothetical protein
MFANPLERLPPHDCILAMSDLARAKQHRAMAIDLRAKATETKWAEVRDQLMELARQYDLLAESIERQRGPLLP